jgi:hypothetical protein
MIGVDLVGSRRIEPAHVGCAVAPDGSRRLQKDRLDDQTDDQCASDRASDGRASKEPGVRAERYCHYSECTTVRDILTALQTLPRDAELLAFEAGCEDYCEREVDEVEWQGDRVYLHLRARRDDPPQHWAVLPLPSAGEVRWPSQASTRSGGRSAPATSLARPPAQGSGSAWPRQGERPGRSSGRAPGRRPRRSRTL